MRSSISDLPYRIHTIEALARLCRTPRGISFSKLETILWVLSFSIMIPPIMKALCWWLQVTCFMPRVPQGRTEKSQYLQEITTPLSPVVS
ncbi:hypothetical protein BDV38DRAFT_12907 [Aspergillus pseudotamarii]|uniref:Uncharacterized protein n=1 Tax=Aspergillus pseudotamarii TaxID=132259 RepID=A0A5N6SAZ8_ASPPS|nr:uncharacterized protein BDV38DRAFT_12907 [Aspergillus pseudotamarii]KAE8131765.1 hypothetical protein BDV38DRAFT_12907 [Aspergillus pseudotamarii]